MSTSALVREATLGDLDPVRTIAEVANAEFASLMGDRLYAGYLANVLDVERRVREAVVLVAERDGAILGTITLYADIHREGMPVRMAAGTAGIRATAVDPAARGQGIGGALVTAALERARRNGSRAVALHTAAFMVDAMRLYARHGFERQPAHDYVANDFFAATGGERLDALAFVHDLGSRR